MDEQRKPADRWVVVANVVEQRLYGEDKVTLQGTKHFRPNAKVYIVDAYRGMCSNVVVIGRHRKSMRFITITMDIKHLANFRVALLYNPEVIRRSKIFYPMTKEDAEQLCKAFPYWQNS